MSGDDFEQRARNLQAAFEGECDGMAIDLDHAKAILEYIDSTPRAKWINEYRAAHGCSLGEAIREWERQESAR